MACYIYCNTAYRCAHRWCRSRWRSWWSWSWPSAASCGGGRAWRHRRPPGEGRSSTTRACLESAASNACMFINAIDVCLHARVKRRGRTSMWRRVKDRRTLPVFGPLPAHRLLAAHGPFPVKESLTACALLPIHGARLSDTKDVVVMLLYRWSDANSGNDNDNKDESDINNYL